MIYLEWLPSSSGAAAKGLAVFIVTSRYHAPSEAIARALLRDAPILVLDEARGVTRADLDALLASDPFRLQDLLVHDVVELQPTRWIEALAELEGAA